MQGQNGNCSDMEKLTVILEVFLLTHFIVSLIPVFPLFFLFQSFPFILLIAVFPLFFFHAQK